MFRNAVPAVGGRAGWIAVAVVVGMLSVGAAYAQQPPAQQPAQPAQPAQQAQAQKSPYVFSGTVRRF